MRILSLAVGILFFISLNVFSQESSLQKSSGIGEGNSIANVPKEIQASCTAFFKLLVTAEVDKAFETILKNSPIAKKDDQIKNLIDQTKKSFKLYGNMQGYEPVNSEQVTESLLRVRYLSIHPDMPMRWIITYYNSPSRGWIVINIKFDDLAEYFFTDQ
ncbi:MAG: hypothetical protein A2X61_01450 [Ignavibacteria bacterium GWB2_35_12]|nr:MAG: hypothetical protein A2X63_05625 [Ignavibacteria bacterium GWA2_35_8]OGU41840.1 MAG: hypothetical protein A2X61_01450 [Ignavibacteria bacterium GWB2_35_12]OGU86064.1 MAG: hypothetical protein A2220_04775 [Ignavibacteria bacterium RIFOXYA2_FULL_35_10]OGV23514.1 MAG: hypothetical protein A2475_06195 [Ignavibacteria bacterium RIFOXYC2_FULL_35_21]